MGRLRICECYTGYWIWLNNPEYVLIMLQYAYVLIMLNMITCAGIYLKKQPWIWKNSEYIRWSTHIRSLYKLLSSYQDRCIENTVKHLRWSVCKRQRGGGGGASIRVLHNQGLCFQNQDTFFNFLKEQGRPPISSLVQHMKCGWISINIPDYPKTSLRLFEQTLLIMPGLLIDSLTCSTRFWRYFRF